MVSEAIVAGYVKRVVSQLDGRKACLELTEAGKTLAADLRHQQYRFFAAHLKGWSSSELREFAGLLTRFTGRMRAREHASAKEPATASEGASKGNVVPFVPGTAVRRRRSKDNSR